MAAPTFNVNGKDVTEQEARELLLVPPDYCLGCWLGDASPEAHDYGYGCELGAGAEE